MKPVPFSPELILEILNLADGKTNFKWSSDSTQQVRYDWCKRIIKEAEISEPDSLIITKCLIPKDFSWSDSSKKIVLFIENNSHKITLHYSYSLRME